MSRTWPAGGSVLLRRVPRWLSPAALFVVSFGLHYETLLGGFVWDDRPAVVGNQDVWAESSWGDIWRHDFWGQQIAHAESHKSFRPLTTVTFKLNNFLAQKISREQQDNTITFSDQQRNDENVNSMTTAEFVEKKEDFARGAGPERTDAAFFHLFNVIVHAATCSSSVWLFREELPAVAASLLFTVHPVHVEAVAPIVGRADLLCGFLSVIALSLAIKGTSSRKQRQSRNIGLESPDRGEVEDHQQEQSSRRPPCYFGSSSDSSSSGPVEIDESFRDLGLAPTIRDGEQEVVQLESKQGESVVVTAGQSRQGEATGATATKGVPHTGTQGLATSLSTTGPSPTSSAAAGGEKPIGSTTEEATYLTAARADVGMAADTGTRTAVTVDTSDNEGETFVTPALHCESYFAKTQEPGQNLLSGNNDLSSLDDTPGDDAGRAVAAEASIESSNDATPEARGSFVTMETMKPPATALEAPLGYVSSREHNDEAEKGTNVMHRRASAMAGGASCPPSPVGFKPAMTSKMVPGKGAPSMRHRAAIVKEEKDSGPGVTRYCAALLFAACATLCKEVGIAVFGLMAGGEVVRFFEEREWRQRKRKLWQRRRSGVIASAGKHGIWRKQALRECWRCRFMMRVPAASAARVVSATIFAVLLVYLHVRLHEGARVREWGVLENDISILPRWVRSSVADAPLNNP
ncbi:unnamed protein product [Ectocarpus sp. 12 AP-2014]